MHIFELWVFCFIVSVSVPKFQGRLTRKDFFYNEKYKRHAVTGRKGVTGPHPFVNVSGFPLLAGLEYRRLILREKRSPRNPHHHRPQHHTPLHHTKYQDKLEKYRQQKQEDEKKSKNTKPTPAPKKKSKKSMNLWMKNIASKFHLPKKPTVAETRQSWYLMPGKGKKPFVADVDLCLLDQCYNKGTCISDPASPSGFRCICPPGVIGDKCQTVIRTCELEPCQNGATCKPKHSGAKYKYFCICTPQYTGELCEVPIDRRKKPDSGGESNDFFDPKRERNIRAENLIAVSVTVLVLTILFIILCFGFQICKRKHPPPSQPVRSRSRHDPPTPKSPSPEKSKPEYKPEEVYCPIWTQVCRQCCAFFLEKKPTAEKHSNQRLTVVKKASSCGQLTTRNSIEMAHVQPRQASSHPSVHFSTIPESQSLHEEIVEDKKKTEVKRKDLLKESKEWLKDRILTGTEGEKRKDLLKESQEWLMGRILHKSEGSSMGMARVQPTDETGDQDSKPKQEHEETDDEEKKTENSDATDSSDNSDIKQKEQGDSK